MNPATARTHTAASGGLYRTGAAAALLCALLYLVALGVYVAALRVGPPPATVREWFALYESSPVTGLFSLGLADVAIMVLWVPMVLALYGALRISNRDTSFLAAALAFVGIAVFLASNTAFSMLSLSRQFAVPASEPERSLLLAAGEAVLAMSEGTGARYLGMPLAWLAGLILSVVMLRGGAFSRLTAWLGIVGLGLLVASAPMAGYTTTGPASVARNFAVALTYAGGGVLSLAWYLLVALALLRLGRETMGMDRRRRTARRRLEAG
jgi:hypothetical protein